MKGWRSVASTAVAVIFLTALASAALFSSHRTEEDIRSELGRLPEHGKSRLKAVLISELGIFLHKKGDMVEAAQELENSLNFDTNRSMKRQIYLYLGKSYESSGRMDRAIAAYEQAAVFDPSNWKRQRDIAQAYENVKLYGKAISYYEKAMVLDRREVEIWFPLGRAFRQAGYYEKAEVHLKKALEMSPDDTDIMRELSLVYEGQGRFLEAALMLEKSVTGDSLDAQWGRLVYLGLLAHNASISDRGMNGLMKKGTPETLHFYSALGHLLEQGATHGPRVSSPDPTLQALLDSFTVFSSTK